MANCVVCGSELLEDIVEIGKQYPSAIFCKSNDPFRERLKASSLNITKCSNRACNLIQLSNPISLDDVFAKYPYQTSTTISMKSILTDLRDSCNKRLTENLVENDVILDIGGNDGTFLALYDKTRIQKVNIDAAQNIQQVCIDDNYTYINELFSAEAYKQKFNKPPRLITSTAMFYHLHNPVEFTNNIASIMDESTIWCIQMSYAASMIENCVVDNIVHEHVTYYTFQSLSHLMDICNLEIFDAEVIDVYGGSIRAFIKKKSTNGGGKTITRSVKSIIENERRRNTNEESSLIEFNEKSHNFRRNFSALLEYMDNRGENIYGFGASTKGNMLLQFLNLDESIIKGVFDNSPKKIGTSMLGSNIKVIDEKEMHHHNPSALISLPYYYHNHFLNLISKLKPDILEKLTVIQPLPNLIINHV